jgi:hypothetical protein
MKMEFNVAEEDHRPCVLLNDNQSILRAPVLEVYDGWVKLVRSGAGPIQHRQVGLQTWQDMDGNPSYLIYPREQVGAVVG